MAGYSKLRRMAYKLSVHPLWGMLVYLLIVLNTLILAADQHPAIYETLNSIEQINQGLNIFFIVEQSLKVFGLGWRTVLQEKINVMDLVVTGLSSLQLIIKSQSGAFNALPCLRILRLFRLFVSGDDNEKSVSLIMASFFQSLQIFLAFCFLFVMNIYVFSIIGMILFQQQLKFSDDKLDLASGTSPRHNFDTLGNSFNTVFTVMLRQHWNQVWYKCYLAVGGVAHLYFLLLLIIG